MDTTRRWPKHRSFLVAGMAAALLTSATIVAMVRSGVIQHADAVTAPAAGQGDTSALDSALTTPTIRTAAVKATVTPAVTPAPTPIGVKTVAPTRLLDTRATARVTRGSVATVVVAGQGGVPATGAKAGVLTITAVRPSAAGFVSAVPCGAAFGTSNLNVVAGETIANTVVVGLGAKGDVCITSSTDTDLLVDVIGYAVAGGSTFRATPPTRVTDSRTTGTRVAAGTIYPIHVGGVGGVPATGATAVAASVTVTDPAAAGFVTVMSCGGGVPTASNVNVLRGETRANSVIAPVDATGQMCLFTSAAAHIIVDVAGWFGSSGDELRASDPLRLLDSRLAGGPRVAAGATVKVYAGTGAKGTVLNVTATDTMSAGYLTAWPCDQGRPATSSVGFVAGQTIADAVVTGVAADGTVCIFASAAAHIVVDRTATFAPAGTPIAVASGSAVTDWALGQIGDVYAAMNPYRFGASKYGKAWDCPTGQASCDKVDTQGITRTAPTGSFVYDCSGLVVAAWLQSGIDLVKANASWTVPMMDLLPRVSRAQARPGDLVMFQFDPSLGESADHVGLYLSDTEMVHAGTCAGASASQVCRTGINWAKVVAILRPIGA